MMFAPPNRRIRRKCPALTHLCSTSVLGPNKAATIASAHDRSPSAPSHEAHGQPAAVIPHTTRWVTTVDHAPAASSSISLVSFIP